MMKYHNTSKIFLTLLGSYALFWMNSYAQVPDDMHSPRCIVHQKVGMTAIEISYSRPGLKGRKLYGEIINEDTEWRTGANAATTIRFDDEVMVNDQKLKPGIYAIYSIPNKEQWVIIFNINVYSDPYKGRMKEADALHIEVPVIKTSQPVETFTIFIADISKDNTKASIDLMWENTLLKIPLEVPDKWSG